MKHLLFIMTDLRGGGAEKSLTELLKSIDYKEYKVSLCLLFYQGVYLADLPKAVDVICLFKKRISLLYLLVFGLYRIFKNTYLLSSLLKSKTQRKYDVILSATEGFPLLLHRFIVDRGEQNISWIHCDLYNFHYTETCFHKTYSEFDCYKKMDKLVFVSHKSMDSFNKLFQLNTPKYNIYNIVDTDEILKQSVAPIIPKQHFTITSIGSLIPVKGFERIIRVARRLKDLGYSFRVQIIGEGFKGKELVELRNSLGLQEEVSFLGFQKPPYPYLKQSDILVSTSFSEGLPYVICEALTLGIPVVATQTAGSMELLGNNEFGILTEQDDASILQGIKSLMDNHELRKQYIEKGKERTKEFTRKHIINQFDQLINDTHEN